jgi:ABC-2 type transport system permease protein
MSLYLALAQMSFRKQLAYRAANLSGVATNGFFGALRVFVMLALFENRETVNGWTAQDAVTYVALTQAFIMVVSMWGNNEQTQSIVSGEVASDLSKPVDYYAFWLARFVGRSVYGLVFRGALTFAVIWLFFRFTIPLEPLRWLAFLAALTLAVLLSFSIHFLASTTAFWTLDVRGINALLGTVALLMSGFLVPIAFFPPWLATVAQALPWAGMIQVPIDVYLGKLAGLDLARALAFETAWFLALMLAGRLVVRLMLRRLVIQGG